VEIIAPFIRLLIFLFAAPPLRVYRVFLSRTIPFSRFVRYRSRPCNVVADALHISIMRFFLYALPFPGIFLPSSDLQLFQIYLPEPVVSCLLFFISSILKSLSALSSRQRIPRVRRALGQDRELRSALVVLPDDEGNYGSGCRLRRESGNRIAIDKSFYACLPPEGKRNIETSRYNIIASVILGHANQTLINFTCKLFVHVYIPREYEI